MKNTSMLQNPFNFHRFCDFSLKKICKIRFFLNNTFKKLSFLYFSKSHLIDLSAKHQRIWSVFSCSEQHDLSKEMHISVPCEHLWENDAPAKSLSLKMDVLQMGAKIVSSPYCLVAAFQTAGVTVSTSVCGASAVVSPTLWPGSIHPSQAEIHLQKRTWQKPVQKGRRESRARSIDRLAHTAWPVSSWTSIETDWSNALHLPNRHSSQRGFGWRQGKHCKNEFALVYWARFELLGTWKLA